MQGQSAWDAPSTYFAFAQGAPARQQPHSFARLSSENGSSSPASSSFANAAFAGPFNSFNRAYQRNVPHAQALARSALAPIHLPQVNANNANPSLSWWARPRLPPGPNQLQGSQFLGHDPGWRVSDNVQTQRESDFGTHQLREALPPANIPRSAVNHSRGGPAHSSGFQPMMVVSQPEKRRDSLTAMQRQTADSGRFSTRYHGMHTDGNASVDNLPNELNCSLWLTNLPADVDYPELLRCIRHVGRVYCTFINYPDGSHHHTAAAKVVFFTPAAAQKFLSESWTQTLFIREHRVRASYNRIRTPETRMAGNKSRVLIITGSVDFVNPANLRVWFGNRFQFHEDQFFELIKAGDRVVWEFRFGSYRCQSQMGKMSLEKDRPAGFEKVEFGDDPCELGETMASYGIAAERIQGKGLY